MEMGQTPGSARTFHWDFEKLNSLRRFVRKQFWFFDRGQ